MIKTHRDAEQKHRRKDGHRTRVVAAVMAAAVVVAGCGSAAEETAIRAQSEDASATAASSQDSPETGRAPGLVMNTITGGQIDAADLLGQDAVLWFWAPW